MAEPNGIFVSGLDHTRRQMRFFAPELLKEMNAEVRNILQPIVTDAKNLVPEREPLSGWNRPVQRPGSQPSYSPYGRRWEYDRLAWDPRAVKRGIRVGVGRPTRRRDSFKAAYAIRNANPAGAVYELMGSGKSRTNMVRSVRSTHGLRKRLIWRAWDKAQAQERIPREVVDTIRAFEAKLQQRLRAKAPR